MNAAAVLNALAASLRSLGEALAETVSDLEAAGPSAATRLADVVRAKGQIDAAAGACNDAAAVATLADGDAAALESLTRAIGASAARIASDEQNVARIAGIGRGLITLSADLAGGNIAGAVASANDVRAMVGG